MGSAEGSGGVVGRDFRRQLDEACSPGIRKDELRAVNVSSPPFWSRITDSKVLREASLQSSLNNNNGALNRNSGNVSSPSLTQELEAKFVIPRSGGKAVKSSSGCVKRPRIVQTDVFKHKSGIRDVNGIPHEIASSEKTQIVKQKSTSNCKRGDKRNPKVYKNRSDSFSRKNGLVSFNSAAGGSNFYGIYGLKSEPFDSTQYVNETSLDELISGTYKSPHNISKKEEKKTANSNIKLLESVRKACSLIQDRKALQAPKCDENDNSGIQSVPEEEMDTDKGDTCTADLSSSIKVQESSLDIKSSTPLLDSPIYHPNEVLARLSLPPPKDLDSLLFDATKPNSSSKNSSTDPRLTRQLSQRSGLPPFPWSHSFSGHNKSGADVVKLAGNRTICHGKWVKVKNLTAREKGSSCDLVVDFESLTFDHSLVPSRKESVVSELPENEMVPTERVLSSLGVCSTSDGHAGNESPTCIAAQTLCEMSTQSSKLNSRAPVDLLKKPSQMSMKACHLKAIKKSDKSSESPKLIKLGENGFPSKKPRLSADTTPLQVGVSDSPRKGISSHLSLSPGKLFRDSSGSNGNYGINLVKKSYLMKPPRGEERPKHKLGKVIQMKRN